MKQFNRKKGGGKKFCITNLNNLIIVFSLLTLKRRYTLSLKIHAIFKCKNVYIKKYPLKIFNIEKMSELIPYDDDDDGE